MPAAQQVHHPTTQDGANSSTLHEMRPLVMGILNVTPDSFSDGGRYLDFDAAVAHGMQMVEEGADVVDVGGESSRPGASQVPEDEEIRRVLPVVAALAGHVRVSVDTCKRAVAEAAVAAGATLVNDISATLWPVASVAGPSVGWVAMHMKGTPGTMQLSPAYDDVVGEVHRFLMERAALAAEAGVEEIWIDPGIGFGKGPDHNLSLVRHLDALVGTGFPVLLGVSRKGVVGAIAPEPDGAPAPLDQRLEGSLALGTWGMLAGVAMVRVHDVRATVQAAELIGPARRQEMVREGA